MPSTYSPNLAITLQADGENTGTWGDITNTNLGTLIEQALVATGTISMLDSTTTISMVNGATCPARCYVLQLTGTITAQRNLQVPAISKPYLIVNNTTGGFAVEVLISGGTGIVVPNGASKLVYANGTNVVDLFTDLSNLNVAGTLNTSSSGVANFNGGFTAAIGVTPTQIANTTSPAQVFGDVSILTGGAQSLFFNSYYNSGYKYAANGTAFVARNDGSQYLVLSGAPVNSGGTGASASLSTLMSLDLVNNRVGVLGNPGNYALDVNGTGHYAGALTADISITTPGIVSPTGSTLSLLAASGQFAALGVVGSNFLGMTGTTFAPSADNAVGLGTTADAFQEVSAYLYTAGPNSALVSGGSTAYSYTLSSAGVGIFAGTGAPTISAPKGSIYLENGSGAVYTNTSGSTTWSGGKAPTTQSLTSSGTYTTPSGVRYIKVKMVGGGGGGGGTGSSVVFGSNGGTTIFNSINANGGSGGGGGSMASGGGGSGGTGGSGSANMRVSGTTGCDGTFIGGGVGYGGAGGNSPYFAGGAAARATATMSAGYAAVANTGGGGGGAIGPLNSVFPGGGGGSGEYVELVIASPAATYSYTIGAGGAGGIGSTETGGPGGSGFIYVEEYYSF